MTNSANLWIKEAFKKLRKEFGRTCLKCGSKRRLQFAHLEPTGLRGRGRGRKERYYDIKNNRDKYILLCPKCHKEFDSIVNKQRRSKAVSGFIKKAQEIKDSVA